jgi:4-aminobutyrate aminotransferase-like enzyme
MPLGATVARADLMTWPPGAHASTFGGNPVACAAALATIALLEGSLVDNAARMGAYLRDRMRDWPARFPIVGEVRGLGLMIGIELVRDQQSKTRARNCATAWSTWHSSADCWCWAPATIPCAHARAGDHARPMRLRAGDSGAASRR